MAAFGALSYAIVGILYATLSVLLLTSWRGRHLGGYLIAACVMSTLWGITLAVSTSNPAVPALAVFSIEVLRGGAWLTFLVMLVRKIGVSRQYRLPGARGLACACCLPGSCCGSGAIISVRWSIWEPF